MAFSGGKNTRFTSRQDALSRAKSGYACMACHCTYPGKRLVGCPRCGEDDQRQLGSKAELTRFQELSFQVSEGRFYELDCQVTFPLWCDGEKVGSYRCDFIYRRADRGGAFVVEDVKPIKYMEPIAKLKIALFDAYYSKNGPTVLTSVRQRVKITKTYPAGMTVTIVERKARRATRSSNTGPSAHDGTTKPARRRLAPTSTPRQRPSSQSEFELD